MTSFRFILAAASLILAGACGGGDEDIAQEVGDAESNPQYGMPEDEAGPDPVLTEDPDPSRDAEDALIPEPETDTELEPEMEEPVTPDSGAEPQSAPEDGMPEPETAPQ